MRAFVAANQPPAAIRAFDEIERILSENAETQGESRDKDRRILIVPPIGVIFRAKPETGQVLILDAWMIAGRGPS
jgi:hypothetical protein